MNIYEAFKISLEAIWANKMRSILTMLGLIIGISSVVTIVSLGNGTQDDIASSLESLGVNTVYINYARNVTQSPSDKFVTSDIDKIMENFLDELDGVVPSINKSASIIEDISEPAISFNAVNKYSENILDLNIVSGRFINEFDIDGYKNNVVIDSSLAEKLFSGEESTTNKILINSGKSSSSYNIVGVYEKAEDETGYSSPTVYLAYTTMDMKFSLKGEVNSIMLSVKSEKDPTEVGEKVVEFIERSKGNSGDEKYSIFSAVEKIEMVTSTLGTMTLFVSAIAGVSLLVGGIGVMNIMLVSVTERTKEIGIRKALGAKYIDIMLQFLIEAVTISVLGGFIGSMFGIVFIKLGSDIVGIEASLSLESLLLAVAFSTSIGIFFGIYPARRAAKLNPIEALRYE
ncbi:MAG: ABC transporter permease [Acidaminobacteraceae bacterium]